MALVVSRPIFREEALRRYSDPSRRDSKPLLISGGWFVLLWALLALLGAAGAALALVQVPDLTTVQATVTRYAASPAPRLDVTAQMPQDRPVPHPGDPATVRLTGWRRPLDCQVADAGGAVVEAEQLRKRFGTAAGPARLAVLACRISPGEDGPTLVRRAGQAVVRTGTVAAGSLLFGGDA
ncbi:hypothetical protein [Sphaerisporangium fuscum]|uniref:hypothetical protein n=1 Tax=Sphaerisporangium fuscum TaxID=2835868 RepID=UPI001BDC030F|nr:hypothetical protein [Sphaerisporangium fuscum]